MNFNFIDAMDYDEKILPDSPFPEWIETDRAIFKQLDEKSLPPKRLRRARLENPGYDEYFTTEKEFKPTYDSVLQWYDDIEEWWENGENAFYVMRNPSNDEFMGTCDFEDVDLGKERCRLGVWVDESYRGNGLAQVVCETLTHIAFENLDFQLIEVEAIPHNSSSVSAVEEFMKTAGGSFDGRLRRATFTPRGDIHDVYRWSITKDEFYDEQAEYDPVVGPVQRQDEDSET